MTDQELQERLERSVEDFAGEPTDWDGVIGAVRSAERRTRMRRVAILVATLAVLVATPAFGIGERLVDLIAGEPAPEGVKNELRRLNDVPEPVLELLDDLSPQVDADRARGVMSVQTTRGQANLWVAPTEDGGFCAYIESPAGGGSSACGNDADFRSPRPGLSMDVRPLDGRAMTDNRLVFGRIVGWRQGDRVELELDDGRRLPARVVRGWVLQEFPAGTVLAQDRASARGRDRRKPGDGAAEATAVRCRVPATIGSCWRPRRSVATSPSSRCARSAPGSSATAFRPGPRSPAAAAIRRSATSRSTPIRPALFSRQRAGAR